MTTCAAAARPATRPSTRPPRCWSAMRCSRWPSSCWRATPRCRLDPAIRLQAHRPAGRGQRHFRHGRWPGASTWRAGPGHRSAEVEQMHARKTGALIKASVMMAAACVPRSCRADGQPGRFATAIGLAFQIQDDLLDVLRRCIDAGQGHRCRQRARQAHLSGRHRRRGLAQHISACTKRALEALGRSAAAPIRCACCRIGCSRGAIEPGDAAHAAHRRWQRCATSRGEQRADIDGEVVRLQRAVEPRIRGQEQSPRSAPRWCSPGASGRCRSR